MSKLTIIEGNSNDKDNTRLFMVKGETGDDGVSPTIDVAKADGVTTLTIEDAEGTKTATIADGEDLVGGVPTNAVIDWDSDEEIPDGYEEIANTEEQRLTTLESDVDDLQNEKISSVFGVGSIDKNITWKPYYVDNINGDDNNDGTQANPFKTLTPIMKLINKGQLKIDMYLTAGQTFELPLDSSKGFTTFNACTLHIMSTSTTTNATITSNLSPTTDTSLVFYNCHANFQYITFENIGKEMYFDGGSFYATGCNFNCKLTNWGAGFALADSTIKTLKARSCNIWTNSCTVGCIDSIASIFLFETTVFNTSYAINHYPNECFHFTGGTISIVGVSSIDTDNTPAYDILLYISGAVLMLGSTLNVSSSGTNFTTQSRILLSKIVATTVRLTALETSANGITYADGTEYPQ